jgi:hypothetical protein
MCLAYTTFGPNGNNGRFTYVTSKKFYGTQ